jgi:hypothetical protein
VNVTTAPVEAVACTVIFAGTVTTGASVSTTVTVKLALDLLPDASVAVHVTVVVPNGNVEPEAGLQVTGSDP